MDKESREELQAVANTVLRRAQRQGFVVARDIRTELNLAGLPEDRWKDVLALARPGLHFRRGRYYHVSAYSPRLLQEQDQQQAIQRLIRRLIRQYRASAGKEERRQADRIAYLQPVIVEDQDGRRLTLLSRDLSTTGIRLLGIHRLLGQKVHLLLPQKPGQPPCRLLVRILWTCAVADGLFENGATFLEVVEEKGK